MTDLKEEVDKAIENSKKGKPLAVLNTKPAYGRDYRTEEQVVAAWNAGKDFQISDLGHPDNGRYVNIDDVLHSKWTHISVFFNKGKRQCLLRVNTD